jgi:hypothetical protein
MSGEIAAEAPQAPPTGAAGKNHAFCRRSIPMSAEIAAEAPQAPLTGAAGKNRAFCPRTTE